MNQKEKEYLNGKINQNHTIRFFFYKVVGVLCLNCISFLFKAIKIIQALNYFKLFLYLNDFMI